jgi:hypothetical protein
MKLFEIRCVFFIDFCEEIYSLNIRYDVITIIILYLN